MCPTKKEWCLRKRLVACLGIDTPINHYRSLEATLLASTGLSKPGAILNESKDLGSRQHRQEFFNLRGTIRRRKDDNNLPTSDVRRFNLNLMAS
eukprot:scaffold48121_cov47-Attheya_sp.AAC.6